jgi:hypothetical protein
LFIRKLLSESETPFIALFRENIKSFLAVVPIPPELGLAADGRPQPIDYLNDLPDELDAIGFGVLEGEHDGAA